MYWAFLLRFGLSRPPRNTPLGECSYDLEEILSALAAFIKVVGARYGCHHDFRLDELKTLSEAFSQFLIYNIYSV